MSHTAQASPTPNLNFGRSILLAAAMMFVCVKLAMIILPLNALGVPRIGDDALYYLWKAKQFANGYTTESPALTDIPMQHGLDDSPSNNTEWWRSRIHTKTIGTQSPLYDAINGLILKTNLPLKIVFAISEAIIIIVLAVGMASFLSSLFGRQAAALGIVFLAFPVLANQGLDFFIPALPR